MKSLGFLGVGKLSERAQRQWWSLKCPAAPVETQCPALPLHGGMSPWHTPCRAWLHHVEEGKLQIAA